MRALSKLIVMAALLVSSAMSSAAVLNVGTWGGSGCCDFGTRGYWFTAPENFTISSVYLPMTSVRDSTLQVVRFNSPIPYYASTTNDFVSLGYWEDVVSASTNIAVNTGDIIGILGWADGFTPYRDASGNYATTLNGHNITLQRLGFQYLGTAHDVWTEIGTIGTIGMTYNEGGQTPEPSALLLLALALSGLWFVRQRVQKV